MVERKYRASERKIEDEEGKEEDEHTEEPYLHQSIFHKFDLEVDHIKSSQFTEHDKKRVIENYLQNEEVLFFLYGMLFPNSAELQELSKDLQK